MVLIASMAVFTSAPPSASSSPTEDEHAAVGLVAVEPAALVGTVGIGEHAVGVEAQPGGLGEGAHGTGLERLRRAHQDALERRHLPTPTSSARWAIMVTLLNEARPARALSSVAGSSPRVRARWTR